MNGNDNWCSGPTGHGFLVRREESSGCGKRRRFRGFRNGERYERVKATEIQEYRKQKEVRDSKTGEDISG